MCGHPLSCSQLPSGLPPQPHHRALFTCDMSRAWKPNLPTATTGQIKTKLREGRPAGAPTAHCEHALWVALLPLPQLLGTQTLKRREESRMGERRPRFRAPIKKDARYPETQARSAAPTRSPPPPSSSWHLQSRKQITVFLESKAKATSKSQMNTNTNQVRQNLGCL